MKAKLTRVDHGVMLVSEEPLFDQFGDGEVEVSVNGKAFTVAPVQDEQLTRILDEMDEQYRDVFRRLAE